MRYARFRRNHGGFSGIFTTARKSLGDRSPDWTDEAPGRSTGRAGCSVYEPVSSTRWANTSLQRLQIVSCSDVDVSFDILGAIYCEYTSKCSLQSLRKYTAPKKNMSETARVLLLEVSERNPNEFASPRWCERGRYRAHARLLSELAPLIGQLSR